MDQEGQGDKYDYVAGEGALYGYGGTGPDGEFGGNLPYFGTWIQSWAEAGFGWVSCARTCVCVCSGAHSTATEARGSMARLAATCLSLVRGYRMKQIEWCRFFDAGFLFIPRARI